MTSSTDPIINCVYLINYFNMYQVVGFAADSALVLIILKQYWIVVDTDK